MRHILSLLEKFLTLFKKKKIESNLINANLGSISFIINEDTTVVVYELPTILDDNIKDIPEIAEKYAKLLSAIAFGEMNDILFDNMRKMSKKMSSNDNEVLLANNILSFWAILYKEKQNKAINNYQYKDVPLIRPSQAFKT